MSLDPLELSVQRAAERRRIDVAKAEGKAEAVREIVAWFNRDADDIYGARYMCGLSGGQARDIARDIEASAHLKTGKEER